MEATVTALWKPHRTPTARPPCLTFGGNLDCSKSNIERLMSRTILRLMTDEPDLPEPDNWKWFGTSTAIGIALIALAVWIRFLPASDAYVPGIVSVAVMIGGFASAGWLRSWNPRVRSQRSAGRRQIERRLGAARYTSQ